MVSQSVRRIMDNPSLLHPGLPDSVHQHVPPSDTVELDSQVVLRPELHIYRLYHAFPVPTYP